jgi:[glutamine synthetase] adenylyltransferase / [glutamine synthetase]-adenylyl-L-tyrosine phosphorylase
MLIAMDATAFAPGERALARQFEQLLDDHELAAVLLQTIRDRAPDEHLALAHLLQLADRTPGELHRVLADPAATTDLIFCLGSSQIVAADLVGAGASWPAIFAQARSQTAAQLLAATVFTAPPNLDDKSIAIGALGHFKRSIFLRIAIADLLGVFTVPETTTVLSRLAEECIRGALDATAEILKAPIDPAREFCVLAMGKLGAGELNLSSDIDLVYLLDGAHDPTRHTVAQRFGETLTEILSAECFRVDLRLRPGGRSSPLVVTMEGALTFYENLGDTWERAALLRARPIAGAIGLGASLLTELDRFIYRRYFDFETLEQLRAMKHQIETELRSPAHVESNIKLGRGGIRELEFIVQALSLIYGGRDQRLRTPKTLEALDRLHTYGYLSRPRAERLQAAYLLLRDLEHKLQVVAGLQTHTLPDDDRAYAQLAARMRWGKDPTAVSALRAELAGHREFVANQFREMLAGGEERAQPDPSSEAQAAWLAANDQTLAVSALRNLGFARPADSANSLKLLAVGPEHVPASERRRELIDRLGPLLLDEISCLPDPDLALLNLAACMATVGARTSFLALLEEHPATRKVLLKLFASSSHLSTLFTRHPEMLDTLVRSDLARPRRSEVELRDELSGMLAASAEFESRLDALRSFRQQEFLRIAIADLAGHLELEEVESELTLLAATCLREGLTLARSELATRYRIPPALKLCALAMGRLGAAEMSYNSDLDLIFVYHLSGEIAANGHEHATRIVQKLISVLEARTREGFVYKLDLRLRPSGNAGPLVASLDGFRDYHRQSSAVWERQALVRARVIAGDDGLGREVERARREFVFGRGLEPREVAEIALMRLRMEKEIGAETFDRLNLKQGPGGLVDVEFLTQMMALRHGHEFPELRVPGTVALIRALAGRALLTPTEAGHLEVDYRFLQTLENHLRIETDQAAWALPTDAEKLTPLARRTGFDGPNGAVQLLAELEHRRSRIRAIFEACFTREQQGGASASTHTAARI